MTKAAGATLHDTPDGPGTTDTPVGGRLAVVAALLIAVALVVGTVGPPLFGRGVFLTADTVYFSHPWRAHESPAVLEVPRHGPTTDTVDAIYPSRVRFAEAARAGTFLDWDPLVVGGTAAASESANGVLNPIALTYLLAPAWYAPAAAKALQMVVAVAFTYLFCRRVGTTPLPALFAGVAFAGSGFLVMWTNWQHPEVAAFIPVLFWAAERHLQQRTPASVVPIALALAAMLLGGFPAIVGYALYVLAGYIAIRLFAQRDRPGRARLATAGGAGAGVVAGVLLAAVVLVPFAMRMPDLDLGDRAEGPGDSLGIATLVTAVAPDALGLSTRGPGAGYFGTRNQVEGISFVGVTTVLAALAALCLPRPRAMPPGVRTALAAATLVVGAATFAGGLPLRLLQVLPVFSDNYIGRTRSVLGFVVAVLAALGLQALLERRPLTVARGRVAAATVLAATAALALLVGVRALDTARDARRTDVLGSGLVVPLAVAVVAAGVLAVVRFGPRRAAPVGLVGLSALLVAESLRLSLPLLPNEDRRLLYPTTPGLEFLADHQGHDRVAPEGFTLFGHAAALFDLRSVTGHTFHAASWKEAILAADQDAFDHSPTYAALRGDEAVMRSPVLDRLGVRWFAATPQHVPPGRREDHGFADASCERPVTLSEPLTVTLPAGDGVRAVVVRTCGSTPLPSGASLTASLDDGRRSASGTLRFAGAPIAPQPLALAVPAEDLGGAGRVVLTLTPEPGEGHYLHLATTGDGDVGLEIVRPANDGLRLAFADDLRIYERTGALARIRWAGRAIAVEDPDERLAALAGGEVDPDTVVLSDAPAVSRPDAGARDADLSVVTDRADVIELDVDAEQDGHVVVADALQGDWQARVDGEPADLVEADHAGVAVAVPAGRHEVDLRHAPRGRRAGLALSSLTAAGLIATVVWGRRRRARSSAPPREHLPEADPRP